LVATGRDLCNHGGLCRDIEYHLIVCGGLKVAALIDAEMLCAIGRLSPRLTSMVA